MIVHTLKVLLLQFLSKNILNFNYIFTAWWREILQHFIMSISPALLITILIIIFKVSLFRRSWAHYANPTIPPAHPTAPGVCFLLEMTVSWLCFNWGCLTSTYVFPELKLCCWLTSQTNRTTLSQNQYRVPSQDRCSP